MRVIASEEVVTPAEAPRPAAGPRLLERLRDRRPTQGASARRSLFVWWPAGSGDTTWLSAALPLLHRAGYVVDVCPLPGGRVVLENNPYVRTLVVWEEQRDPEGQPIAAETRSSSALVFRERYEAWLEALRGQYDEVKAFPLMNETVGLWSPRHREYSLPHAERQTDLCYPDDILRQFGFGWIRGALPELYPSPDELTWLRSLRGEHDAKGECVLLWHATGTAFNKWLPQTPLYVGALLAQYPRLIVYLLHDERALAIQDSFTLSESVRDRCRSIYGVWSFRQQLLATSIADLVIGPESSIVNASAAFDTPKVIFYSHSQHKNLSRHWWNAYPIHPTSQCECAPCYRAIEGQPEECTTFLDELGVEPRRALAEDGSRKIAGAKCCVFLPHGEILQTISSILEGRRDRMCLVCSQKKNRLTVDGTLSCVCGVTFEWRQPQSTDTLSLRDLAHLGGDGR